MSDAPAEGTVATFELQQMKTATAMDRHRQRQAQETEILDARVMHRNAMKRINTRILKIEKELARLNCSVSMSGTLTRDGSRSVSRAASPTAGSWRKQPTDDQLATSSSGTSSFSPRRRRQQEGDIKDSEPSTPSKKVDTPSSSNTAPKDDTTQPSPQAKTIGEDDKTQTTTGASPLLSPKKHEDDGDVEKAKKDTPQKEEMVEKETAAKQQDVPATKAPEADPSTAPAPTNENREVDDNPQEQSQQPQPQGDSNAEEPQPQQQPQTLRPSPPVTPLQPSPTTAASPASPDAADVAADKQDQYVEDLHQELAELQEEKISREDGFMKQLAYLQNDMVTLDEEQQYLVRGVEAQRDIEEFRAKDLHGRALRESWKHANKNFVEEYFSFFEDHQGKSFEELRHFDVERLKDVYFAADANVTKEVERGDIESVIRRVFRDHGVSSMEVKRIMLLLGWEPLDQFSLKLTQFFTKSCELVPLLHTKLDEFKAIEECIKKKDRATLKSRKEAAERDMEDWDSTETRYRSSIHKLEQRAIKEPANESVMESLQNERQTRRELRISWAHRATILTASEESKFRSQSLTKFVNRHPFDHPSMSPSGKNPYESRGVAIPPPRKIKPAPPSYALQEDKKKESLRQAFARAPLNGTLDGRSEEELVNLKKLFYALCAGDDVVGEDPSPEQLNAATMGASSIMSFLKLYWRGGAEIADGAEFLEKHTAGAPLTFDTFILYAPDLKLVAASQDGFSNLSVNDKRRHVQEKHDSGQRLTRFERDFERCDTHVQFQRMIDTAASKRRGKGTSSFLSNRAYLTSPSKPREGRNADTMTSGRRSHQTNRIEDNSARRQTPRADEDVDWGSSQQQEQDTNRSLVNTLDSAATPTPHKPSASREPSSVRSNVSSASLMAPPHHRRGRSSPRNRSNMTPRTPRYAKSPKVRLPLLLDPPTPKTQRLISLSDYRHVQDDKFVDLLRLEHGLLGGNAPGIRGGGRVF